MARFFLIFSLLTAFSCRGIEPPEEVKAIQMSKPQVKELSGKFVIISKEPVWSGLREYWTVLAQHDTASRPITVFVHAREGSISAVDFLKPGDRLKVRSIDFGDPCLYVGEWDK